MKRLLSIMSLLIIGLAAISCYDDTSLWDSVKELQNDVNALKKQCEETNQTLSALSTLVNAMAEEDYIVSVTPLEEDGVQVGYQIVFKHNGVINIYHGEDGQNGQDGQDGQNGNDGADGNTPEFGSKLDEDGKYYWTIDGEWVLDAEGKKIPLITPGATPQLKIENDTWYVSYDDGQTWNELGAAVTVGIKEVQKTDDALIIVMTDGTEFSLPIGSGLKVVFGEYDGTSLQYGNDLTIPYTIEGTEEDVIVFLLREGSGVAVDLVEETALSGKITISQLEASREEMKVKVGIMAVAEDGTTVSKAVRINSGVFYEVEGNQSEYTIDAAGGNVEFKIATNTVFEVKTNADWITYVQTKAVEEKTLTFNVAANIETEARTAEVTLASGDIKLSFTVNQAAGTGEAPFEESLVGAYKIKQIWVYGGTGPNYGGAQWSDIYKKTWWFDTESGHGIDAELDNYFEFSLTEYNESTNQSTGKCTNWAGANGKNWSCWFHNAKVNEGVPADANKFYRQIPIGESTWVRDYNVTPNTVTFTDSEGKTTTLKLYESETEFVPGYGDTQPTNNTRYFPGCYKAGATAEEGMDMAFHATVKGTDNWYYTDKELDVIYDNPRDIFYDFEKVESIPAEAKTTEAKYTPELPETEAPASIAGTYKFRDGKTVGGKDGSITAKGLVEQYGGWDPVKASINSMKDDKFTFTATGTDVNGNETGTVTFDMGADGATWDYKLLDNMNGNKEYDGTDMYCIIATDNTTTYVYDAEAATVTLTTRGKEYVVDFLAAGAYEYSGISVTVPSTSAFGFHLDLGYTEARVAGYSSTSNGFSRHYVWARHHVYLFDKE